MYAHTILAQNQRQFIDFDFTDKQQPALEVIPRNRDQMIELVNKYFKCEEFQKDPDHCKILAWRNASVDFLNKMVREVIYGVENLPKIVEGEKLVMEEPVVAKDRIVLAKNEDVVVDKVEILIINLKYKLIEKSTFKGTTSSDPFSHSNKHDRIAEIKVYKVRLINDDGEVFTGNILHEDSQADYNVIRESIKKAALTLYDKFEKAEMWKEFYGIQSRFFWVNYNYALTIHKSQGSSYQYCISNEWDVSVNRNLEERNQLRYVAATRPKTKLYIVK